MIDDGTPRNAPAAHMHGFLSRDGMPPSELLATGRDEVTRYGGDLIDGAVRYAQIVRQWTHDLVYFTPPDQLTAAERSGLVARAIGVVEGTIEQLVIDDDHLRGVRMTDGSVVPPRRSLRPAPVRPPQPAARRPRLRHQRRRLGHR